MDGMNRNLDGVEFYINGVDTLCETLKQELGEKLYEYPGTWFSESTIKEFYGQNDEIWAIQLSNILGDILNDESDLSEKLKTDIENEVTLLKKYSDDIQRERSEHIPTPDEFFFVKSTRTKMPLEELAKVLSKTDIMEPLVCEFNQSFEYEDYSKDFRFEPEHRMISEGDKYLRITVPADVADVRNLYGYLYHKLEFLSNTHDADLVDTLVLHNDKYMDSIYMNKAVTVTKYDSIENMIKHLEKDGNSIDNQTRTQKNDSVDRKATKRPSIMRKLKKYKETSAVDKKDTPQHEHQRDSGAR